MEENNSFYWLGSDDMSLNKDTIKNCGEIVIGYYGGNTESGADKNEDAAVLFCDKDSNRLELF